MEKYRPANGTEGEWFESMFCRRCKHEDEDTERFCDIHTDALLFGVTDADYPHQWQRIDNKPICVAYEMKERK